jgi:hypothetical protein
MITKVVWDRLLALICVTVLSGILVAGLWPFTPYPKNDVAWLPSRTGLHFGEYGTVLSAGAFQAADSAGGAPCSLEMWFKPSIINDSNTMLAFYSPNNLVSFSLHQSINDLVIQRQIRDRQDHVSKVRVYEDNVLHQEAQVFIAITTSSQGTAFYADGALLKRSSSFALSRNDFVGQLFVGNSPLSNESWSGDLRPG